MIEFGQDRVAMQRKHDDAVNAEAQRILDAGTDVHLSDYGWVALQGRVQDQQSLAHLAQEAALVDVDAPEDPENPQRFIFIDRDNTVQSLSPPQMLALFKEGITFVRAVREIAHVLKHVPGITISDIRGHAYWPKPTTKPQPGAPGAK